MSDSILDKYKNMHNRVIGDGAIWNTPAELLEDAQAYFDYAAKHPIHVEKTGFHMGAGCTTTESRPIILTKAGFCAYMGISRRTYTVYENREAFEDACDLINAHMEAHQFERGAIGVFNANMVMRNLGMTDKVETDLKSSDGSMSPKDVDKKLVESLADKLTGK